MLKYSHRIPPASDNVSQIIDNVIRGGIILEKKHKTLQELTILDGFMFGAVMMDQSI
ncbi:MAG: hypothetical protein IJ137_03825 [Eubacterium sp.]|nr:hypothetical protein [Eubacterium sp.]